MPEHVEESQLTTQFRPDHGQARGDQRQAREHDDAIHGPAAGGLGGG